MSILNGKIFGIEKSPPSTLVFDPLKTQVERSNSIISTRYIYGPI
jgi:hypothetical protein